MATKDPLFDYDPVYYEVIKDVWLPGKLWPQTFRNLDSQSGGCCCKYGSG